VSRTQIYATSHGPKRAGYREDVALQLRDHEEPLSAADALLLERAGE